MLFAVLCKKMPLPEMATAFFRICLYESVSGEETLSQQTFYFLCICHIGALVLGDITIFCASGAKMSFACCHFMERRVKIGDMTLWFYEVYFIKNQ